MRTIQCQTNHFSRLLGILNNDKYSRFHFQIQRDNAMLTAFEQAIDSLTKETALMLKDSTLNIYFKGW